jgi:hypothetical protein
MWSSHTSYCPDISLPDSELFNKFKEPMSIHRFLSLEEVSAAVTRAIRGLKKSGKYPKWNSKSSETLGRGHWEAGGNIEGL